MNFEHTGLIDTDWGGTPVESWSSPDSLAKCGVKEQTNIHKWTKKLLQHGSLTHLVFKIFFYYMQISSI